jgi:cation diffusion facilitator family transporter
MKKNQLPNHKHSFGQNIKRRGEVRTLIVIIITATMMVVEIATGVIYGSVALLADGLHMASHAAALSINIFAYIYARRQAFNEDFSFGTGKVNALGGFTGAVLLAIFALIMVWESIDRLLNPVEIAFNQAIFVAILGLVVNGVSVFILGENHNHSHDTHKNYDHHDHHNDHNLRAAYFHVLADALTSILAIVALLAGKFFGLRWMDPLMGIIGAILVSRWSFRLISTTGRVLLDRQGPIPIQTKIRNIIEQENDTVITDFHLWSIGPDRYSLIVSLQSASPKSPDFYKRKLEDDLNLVHVTIEVNPVS